jgi:hypothetical protein
MRCPICHDEYEDGVRRCADCGVPLTDDDNPAPVGAEPDPGTVSLGRFHPSVAHRITELLYRRGIEHETVTEDDAVRVVVPRRWRDDLRAEFALTWTEVVRRLPEEQASEVLAAGGSTPGWYDPPRGGHIDREGRLVVDTGDDDTDSARIVGPALLTLGAILVVSGWLVFDSAVATLVGIGLAITGLLLPR